MFRFLRGILILFAVLGLAACIPGTQRQLREGPESLRPFGPTDRTLGGPGLVVSSNCIPKYDDTVRKWVSDSESIFDDLNHTRTSDLGRNPRSICVTLENLGATELDVTLLDDRRTGNGKLTHWFISRREFVEVGQSKAICERASNIRVTCKRSCEGSDCHKFRWRVDLHTQ